jgi:hypothetical protein
MRMARVVLSISIPFLLCISLVAQQTTTSSPQALLLLQQSLAALQGNTSISDVTLSGSARRIAGSDDETGTGTVKALAGTGTRIDLSLPSGARSEVRNISSGALVGSWSGPDGVSRPIAYHNLLTDSAWFFPAFGIANRLSATGYVATYIGQETRNGQAVQHVSVSQSSSFQTPPGVVSLPHLSQVDFFLNSTTLLPAAITFNIHPDDNALLDIPIEVRFSDYRAVGSSQVPHHVQKYLNNGLALDFQVQTVTLNSGLTANTFNSL